MSQTHKHAIPANIADRCLINPEQYETKYKPTPIRFGANREKFSIGSRRTKK